MAFTQANLDGVDAAIVVAAIAGFAEFNVGDKGMKRYTLKELTDLREVIRIAVATTAGATTRCTYTSHSKG